MTVEEFELKQSKMSDSELINLCEKEVGELASTYGKSHKMTIPPSIKDTDMLLSELIKRFKMLSEDARWRDPKVELPESNEMVQIEYRHMMRDGNSYSHDRYDPKEQTWNIEEIDSEVKVLYWRPIE